MPTRTEIPLVAPPMGATTSNKNDDDNDMTDVEEVPASPMPPKMTAADNRRSSINSSDSRPVRQEAQTAHLEPAAVGAVSIGTAVPPSPPAAPTNEQTNRQQSERSNGNDNDNEADDDDDGLLFSCRCESARSVTTLLSCLRHVASGHASSGGSSDVTGSALTQARRSRADLSLSAIDHPGSSHGGSSGGRGGGNRAQHATVFAGESGLTFHVHGASRQSQASVDMQSGLFSDYYVSEQIVEIDDGDGSSEDDEKDDQDHHLQQQHRRSTRTEVVKGGEFSINLTTVLECLHVLGTASLDRTKLCLSYDLHDAIFRIELLEDVLAGGGTGMAGGGVISTCAIPGLAVSDDEDHGASGLAVAFRSSPIVARAIVKSDFLRDAIVELSDVPGASSATIGISPSGMDLAAIGYSSECQVSLPHAGNASVFVSLECDPPRVHARTYPLHSVLSAMRGLEIASETCISINRSGMVAIQHQVLDDVGNGQPNFVDFIMGCLQDEDDEAESEDDREDGGDELVIELGRELLTSGTQHNFDEREAGRRRRGAPTTATSTAASGAYASSDEEAEHRRTDELLRTLEHDCSEEDDVDGDGKIVEDISATRHASSSGKSNHYGELMTESSSKSSRSHGEANQRRRARRIGARSRSKPSSPDEDADNSGNERRKNREDGRKRPSPTSASGRSTSRRKKEEMKSTSSHDSDDESTDVECQAIVMPSPQKETVNGNANGDEPPSSPELMYGDTRLGTSVDESRKNIGISRASAFSDDSDDDDFM